MKAKPSDMLQSLATGVDKIAQCNELRESLHRWGYKARFNRRKLAKGLTVYITVEHQEVGENLFQGAHQTAIRSIIKSVFPDSHMTSGGGSSMTFVEKG